MKLWNKCVCLTSRPSIMVIISLLLCTLALTRVWPKEVVEIIEEGSEDAEKMWVPTVEDIAYQDSMYQIITSTQNDLNEIKKDIVHILERLDYADGSWDSIRYVKGGTIDKRRNQ